VGRSCKGTAFGIAPAIKWLHRATGGAATSLLPFAPGFGHYRRRPHEDLERRVNQVSIDSDEFRKVLGCYPTGVCVVTALDPEDRPTGIVVGTFTSVSLDPPLVGFLPDKKSTSWPVIEKAGRFCVNVLGSDQQEICRRLAAKGPEKFIGVEYMLSEHNLPVIVNSLARIECTIHSITEAGDHWFVLGNVLSLETTRDDDPMLFHRGRYGGFAEIA
jgi:flavin reductase (DIM6/NTAB) family NADH-FMN oxidoreductase RutF